MALFSPWGNQQFFDDNGDPAVGWKINTYIGGSNSPSATFTTAAGNISQSNPIILDALGFPANGPIWLSVGASYKFVLTDANGVVKRTQDGITGVTSDSATLSQWIPSGVTPTYISATSFTVPGDQTEEFQPGRRLQFIVAGGLSYGVITSRSFSGGLTTVVVTMELGSLDSGLSIVNLSILRATPNALPILSTPLPIAQGGTGGSTAATARNNLGLANHQGLVITPGSVATIGPVISSSAQFNIGAQTAVNTLNLQNFDNAGRGMALLNSSGSAAGSITWDATTTTYATSSDYRLKENVLPMAGALADVMRLRPVTYNWIADGKPGQGFIAHELQEVVPLAVTGEHNGDAYQAIDPSKIVSLLTAALQELKTDFDAYKANHP